MKTNFTYVLIIRIILFILICLYSILVFGQRDNSKLAEYKKRSGFHLNVNYPLNNQPHPNNNKRAEDVLTNVVNGDINDGQVKLRWSFATGSISTVVPDKSDFKYTVPKGRKWPACHRREIIAVDGEISYSNISHFIGKNQTGNPAEVS